MGHTEKDNPADNTVVVDLPKWERPTRDLQRVWWVVQIAVSTLFVGFHLYTAGFGLLVAIQQRIIHLAFVLILVFLLYGARRDARNHATLADLCLILLSILTCGYLLVSYDEIVIRGGLPTTADMIVSAILTVVLFEAARRVIGLQLATISLIFLVYAYFGPSMPGPLIHPGFGISRLIDHLILSTEGLFGIALGASATFVFLFIFLSALLRATGLDKLFSDVASAVAGGLPGGPAQIAVASSATFGTISGSAVANVTGTGAFTIPLMKRLGYSPQFAAAVEAAASTGGQLMPPIMGAAAFIMTEFTGIPYWRIATGAVLPALLYFLAISAAVYLRALKTGLAAVPAEERPNLRGALARGWHLSIPLVGVIFLLWQGYTPLYAGYYTVLLTVVVSYFRKDTRLTLSRLLDAIIGGAKGALEVALACAMVGFIIGVFSLTGTALTISSPIIALGSQNLFFALLLISFILIFMGMGLPTTVCYMLMATIGAPALIQLGIPVLAAHMFVFYIGLLALVTPPVCLAAYAAAGIAGSPPGRTGWTAARLAIAGYIVPFMFVYSPAFLLIGDVRDIVPAALTGIIGVLSLSAGLEGYLLTTARLHERALLIICGLLMIKPGLWTDLLGGTIILVVILLQCARKKPSASSNVPSM